jgi:hypothetical protein
MEVRPARDADVPVSKEKFTFAELEAALAGVRPTWSMRFVDPLDPTTVHGTDADPHLISCETSGFDLRSIPETLTCHGCGVVYDTAPFVEACRDNYRRGTR